METTQQSRLNKVLASSVLLGSLLTSSTVLATCAVDITRTKPNSLYQDNLDGTVTDLETGLMWQKCSQGQSWNTGSDGNDSFDDSCDNQASKLTWGAAMNAAQTANVSIALGYDDWYVPNKNELASLLELACFVPAINSALFPANNRQYWSSSPAFDSAYTVNFDIGYVYKSLKAGGHESAVRLVRVVSD